MDVATAISILDDHGFADTSTVRKLEVLNGAMWDICSRNPWPFLEANINLNFAGGVNVASNFPADFRAVSKLWRPADGFVLSKMRYDDVVESFGDNLNLVGLPQVFYPAAYTVNFYPQPAAGSGTVSMQYLKRHVELQSSDVEATILLPKQFHRRVWLNGALYQLYLMEDDVDLSSSFERLFEKGLAIMVDELMTLDYEPDYIHITDPDFYSS